VVGGVYYTGASLGPEFRNKYFFADFGRNWIKYSLFNGTAPVIPKISSFAPDAFTKGIVDIKQNPQDNTIFYVNIQTGEILRVRLANLNPVAVITADKNNGSSPLTIHFSAENSFDPRNSSLTYNWDFGDGKTSSEVNPTHTFTSDSSRVFSVKLTVVDSFQLSGSASVFVSQNNPAPIVTISSTANPSTYQAGSTVQLLVQATDSNGVIAKVELFVNGSKIDEKLVEPYNFIGRDVEPGVYKVTAKATDNGNAFSISDTLTIIVTGCSGVGYLTGEGYTNIPGTQVADMTGNPNYPLNPSITAQLFNFEYANMGDNYGGRLRGYLCAPFTGNYTFYIAGDDQAGLFLSKDDNPNNKVLIAYNVNPVPFRNMKVFSTQKSAPVRLIKGVRYYVETQHKQNTGANHMSVAWVLPNGITETPIPSGRLSPFLTSSPLAGVPSDFVTAMKETEDLQITSEGLKIMVSPNPSSGHFNINVVSASEELIDIMILDVTGRILEKKSRTKSQENITLGGALRPGFYFLQVIQGRERRTLKLIKD
jgi:PKD repeat protein